MLSAVLFHIISNIVFLCSPSFDLIRPAGRNGNMGAAGNGADGAGGQSPAIPLEGPVPWEVHKFGGAALENAALYKRCGDRVIAESQRRVAPIPSAVVVCYKKRIHIERAGPP